MESVLPRYACRPLIIGTEFLLNNSILPTAIDSYGANLKYEDIYDMRKSHASGTNIFFDRFKGLISDMIDIHTLPAYDFLMMRYFPEQGRRNFQKFSNLTDLLDEFNRYGFHDVCNSFQDRDVESFRSDNSFLPPGFREDNASSTNIFELLVATEDDIRFGQFINCFQQIFTVRAIDIETEYRNLKRMVEIKKEQIINNF